MSEWWPATRAVSGGVTVTKPGVVQGLAGRRLLESTRACWRDSVDRRGRTYARAGQLMGFSVQNGEARGEVQGSDAYPYSVRISQTGTSLQASCTCPYGCSAGDWCKHAVALTYVLADRLERDAGLSHLWEGEESFPEKPEAYQVQAALERLDKLDQGTRVWSVGELVARGVDSVPLPGILSRGVDQKD